MDIVTIIIIVICLVGLFLLVLFKKYTTLKQVALKLIVEAEKTIIGEKLGDKKFTWVFEKLYSFIPWYLKLFIDKDMLEKLIQEVFDGVKDKLSS